MKRRRKEIQASDLQKVNRAVAELNGEAGEVLDYPIAEGQAHVVKCDDLYRVDKPGANPRT